MIAYRIRLSLTISGSAEKSLNLFNLRLFEATESEMLLVGQPRRHLLTTGWSVFVSSKRLVAGDAFIFLRSATFFR